MLREVLTAMGREDLIGDGKHQLIPKYQPAGSGYRSARRKNSTAAAGRKGSRPLLTQHTGLPPRSNDGSRPHSEGPARSGARKPGPGKRPARRQRA